MSTVDGVLLDVDGTLVDTTYLHAVCWAEALSQQDFQVATVRAHRCIGMAAPLLVQELTGSSDEELASTLTAAHRALYAQHWGHLRPLPGARDLLRELSRRRLQVVLASSASGAELAALRQALDADEWITTATSSDDVDQGKPAPDLVQAALKDAGLAADRALFVGDAVWDAKACAGPGVAFVGLTCGGTDARDLQAAGAVAVHADPAELCQALDGLLGV